jgi:hypothetical protein
MATIEIYRTARTRKRCDDYPQCDRGIQPSERYLRAAATPGDDDYNPSDHWRVLNICCKHMRPEEMEVIR